MSFLEKSTKKSKGYSKYTELCDLPVKVWFEVHKTGDVSKLATEGLELKDKVLKSLSKKWVSLIDEWIKRFDFSDDFKEDLAIQTEIALMQADYIITGKKYLLVHIEIEKEKLKAGKKKVEEPKDIESILAKMSKYYGFKLTSRDLMTDEYYAYLNSISNG